ncbi:hypothetical protein NL676_014832 [Syzygium grande]|nr:hypothetical protein NL676_014832 [Syzygium grande]
MYPSIGGVSITMKRFTGKVVKSGTSATSHDFSWPTIASFFIATNYSPQACPRHMPPHQNPRILLHEPPSILDREPILLIRIDPPNEIKSSRGPNYLKLLGAQIFDFLFKDVNLSPHGPLPSLLAPGLAWACSVK